MQRTRRQVLVGLSALTATTGCGQLSMPSIVGRGKEDSNRSALLLPLSGVSADLGQNLQSAAKLGGGPDVGIEIVDCGSRVETAVAAAQQVVAAGAQMIVGPVFGAQSEAVAKAVRVPVVTLSNNEALAGSNTYVFGVTATQSAQAILSMAAQRNLRSVATVVPVGDFGAQSAAAAHTVGTALGLNMLPTVVQTDAVGLVDVLNHTGSLPDAVYLPVADGTLEMFANALRDTGIQLLGSTQWSTLDLSERAAFRDAWFAAPDPLRFAAFDDAFWQATGQRGGIISGLTFDGIELLRVLGRAGQVSIRGLTREAGFTGVLGPYRFQKNGLCERALGVLKVGAGEFSLIGSTSI